MDTAAWWFQESLWFVFIPFLWGLVGLWALLNTDGGYVRLIGVASLLLLPVLHLLRKRLWRLRLMEDGVSVREFWRWHVWTWKDFSSGTVKRGPNACSFLLPDYPPLNLSMLSQQDAAEVMEACLQHWKAPVLSAPAEVRVRSGFSGFRFGMHGWQVTRWGVTRQYRWGQIDEARILRPSRHNTNCSRIEFFLSEGKRIVLQFRSGPFWPLLHTQFLVPSMYVAVLVQENVSPDRIRICAPDSGGDDAKAWFAFARDAQHRFRKLAAMAALPIILLYVKFCAVNIHLWRKLPDSCCQHVVTSRCDGHCGSSTGRSCRSPGMALSQRDPRFPIA